MYIFHSTIKGRMKKFALRVECCVCSTNNKGESELARSIQNFQQATFKMSGPTQLRAAFAD